MSIAQQNQIDELKQRVEALESRCNSMYQLICELQERRKHTLTLPEKIKSA